MKRFSNYWQAIRVGAFFAGWVTNMCMFGTSPLKIAIGLILGVLWGVTLGMTLSYHLLAPTAPADQPEAELEALHAGAERRAHRRSINE
jgi:F0F1-type ATP synthase assembly protein I